MIATDQRFTKSNPCPICGGHKDLRQGQGVRCAGFLSDDGRYANCTRENYAGELSPSNATPATYTHMLDGECNCGTNHGGHNVALPTPIFKEATADSNGRHHPGPPDHRHQYFTAAGGVEVTRERWDAQDGFEKYVPWPTGTKPGELRIYGAELVTAHPGKPVLIVEGEKCADAARAAGITVTVSGAGGASSPPSVEALKVLAGHIVILWADADKQGIKHMHDIASDLPADCKVYWVEWPDAPEKGDVVDYLATHTPDELQQTIRDAKKYAVANPDLLLGRVADTIKPEPIEWLWKKYIAVGKLNIIDGDPGLGKSALTMDLAARVTKGLAMPDGSPGIDPAWVLVLTAEDGIADTVVPRLLAAGADCSQVLIIEDLPDTRGGDHMPAIPGDIDTLERLVKLRSAKLVIIDPFSAYIGTEIDANNDPRIRRAMAPLAKMAERTRCAILLVRHLTKATDRKALYRGGGSMGIIGACRTGFLVAQDPDGGDYDRVIANLKGNTTIKPDSLKFSTEAALVGDIECMNIAWNGISPMDADSLLEPVDPSALAQAVEFIEEQLDGKKVAVKTMLSRAKDQGITKHTLMRAKGKLKVESVQSGLTDGWFWQAPDNKENL